MTARRSGATTSGNGGQARATTPRNLGSRCLHFRWPFMGASNVAVSNKSCSILVPFLQKMAWSAPYLVLFLFLSCSFLPFLFQSCSNLVPILFHLRGSRWSPEGSHGVPHGVSPGAPLFWHEWASDRRCEALDPPKCRSRRDLSI